MLLLVTAEIVCTITSTLGLGTGLVLLAVGAGGVSAGVMTQDTPQTSPELVHRNQVESMMKKRISHRRLSGKNSLKCRVAKTGEQTPQWVVGAGWWTRPLARYCRGKHHAG